MRLNEENYIRHGPRLVGSGADDGTALLLLRMSQNRATIGRKGVDVRTILVLLSVGFAALGSAAFASGSTLLTGHANQHAVAHSGITGNISFIDDGTTLSVRGTAAGLNPTHAYFSLLYDGPAAGGPTACLPTPNSTQTDAQMIVGFWTVNSDGTGTISVDKTGAGYVSLNDVHTISIRDVNQEFLLQACGEIGVIPG